MKKVILFLMLSSVTLMQAAYRPRSRQSHDRVTVTQEQLLHGNYALPAGQIDTPNQTALDLLAGAIAEHRHEDFAFHVQAFGTMQLLVPNPATGLTPFKVADRANNQVVKNVIIRVAQRLLQ